MNQHTRNVLIRGIYVDNLFQTRNSPEELMEMFYITNEIFQKASMRLRSWRSELNQLNTG